MRDEKAVCEASEILVGMPLPESQVFRYEAADDIIELLYRNPHREFSVTELREVTGHGGKSVDEAVRILTELGLIKKDTQGRGSRVRIRRDRTRKPGDPLLEIPQEEFREPVKAFLEGLEDVEAEVVGVILFGSVARGEADRASDIDIQVIVRGDLVNARRKIQEVRQDVEGQRFDGDRYEIQVLVESVESAESYGEKLREIFREGIKLRDEEGLQRVQEAVFDG